MFSFKDLSVRADFDGKTASQNWIVSRMFFLIKFCKFKFKVYQHKKKNNFQRNL